MIEEVVEAAHQVRNRLLPQRAVTVPARELRIVPLREPVERRSVSAVVPERGGGEIGDREHDVAGPERKLGAESAGPGFRESAARGGREIRCRRARYKG